ncbi:MAG: YjjG family noncanonical pyrimidine nucleotidase [Bacteroidota bacterium]|nr:YjjG family noncanonical pyrimidine nucleotidase [Bacteroidota bacterium]
MYKHLFFDLDRTLWDFEKNSHEVLCELFTDFELYTKGISNNQLFIDTYKQINEELWGLYRQNQITKERLRDERFLLTLEKFSISDKTLASQMGDEYVKLCPQKTHLFPFVHSVLSCLKNNYQLHIITNGFEEVQYQKLKSNDLLDYFNEIITSEQVGYKKPNPEIFNFSFNKCDTQPKECLMIGDDLVADIAGARKVGMNQVFFNPHSITHNEKDITHEIRCLSELSDLL